MKHLMWLLEWVLKAAIFFTLFAFALNNQQDAVLHFFFGTEWRTPMVLVVLTAFTVGVAVGVLGMVPRWWAHRRVAKKVTQASTAAPPVAMTPSAPEPAPPQPPTYGL